MRPILVLLIALGGCAQNPSVILSQPPKFVLTSSRSADAIEQCLAQHTPGIWGAPSVTRGEGQRIMTWMDPNPGVVRPVAAATIREGAEVRTIEMRWVGGGLRGSRFDALRGCAG